jgi:hypothetical protein
LLPLQLGKKMMRKIGEDFHLTTSLRSYIVTSDYGYGGERKAVPLFVLAEERRQLCNYYVTRD